MLTLNSSSTLKLDKSKSFHIPPEANHLEASQGDKHSLFPEITKSPEMDPSLSLVNQVCVPEGDSIHCSRSPSPSSYAHSMRAEVVRFTAKIGIDLLAFFVHISPEAGKTLETALEDLINYFGFFCVTTDRVIRGSS